MNSPTQTSSASRRAESSGAGPAPGAARSRAPTTIGDDARIRRGSCPSPRPPGHGRVAPGSRGRTPSGRPRRSAPRPMPSGRPPRPRARPSPPSDHRDHPGQREHQRPPRAAASSRSRPSSALAPRPSPGTCRRPAAPARRRPLEGDEHRQVHAAAEERTARSRAEARAARARGPADGAGPTRPPAADDDQHQPDAPPTPARQATNANGCDAGVVRESRRGAERAEQRGRDEAR